MSEAATAEDITALRRELGELREMLEGVPELKALLRAMLNKRAPRAPDPVPGPTPPELRGDVRAKLVNAAQRRRKRKK